MRPRQPLWLFLNGLAAGCSLYARGFSAERQFSLARHLALKNAKGFWHSIGELFSMGRRKAREDVLRVLYSMEVGHKAFDEVLGEARELLGEDPQWNFVESLARSVVEHHSEIDACIQPYTASWPLFRMATVDRTILRMSVAEMLYFNEIPYEVTINEAVELAKKYGDAESGGFVNGILGSVHRRLLTDVV